MTILLSVLSSLVVALALLPFRQDFDLAIFVLAFMLPVGLGSALWGFIPGLVAALSSFLLLNYFYIQPYGTLRVHRAEHILVLLGFLALSAIISQLMGKMKDGLAQARDREYETKRLYELSMDLSGLQKEDQILNTLARHLAETFQASRVEILLDNVSAPDMVSWPPGQGESKPPTAITSMQGAHRLLGEIRLWTTAHALNPAEDRLLSTFANQGVLALERSRLAADATRTQVLEQSDQMKSALLSSVSHELRTPLATIKASVTSLRDDSFSWDPSARADLLAAIEEETDNLNQLVGNLLSMSRIEAGALHLEYEWNDLSELVGVAIKRARMASPGFQYQVDIPEDLPLIYVDDALIGQVFNNLLSNSIKYSPPGSVILVRALLQDPKTLLVQVINQSPSVSAANLASIFEKFHRVTKADKITGTGLGLSICKGIIEAHKGQIWAANLPEGFSIQFSLPLAVDGKTVGKMTS